MINEKLFEELENGLIPWHKPWKDFDEQGDFIPPQNYVTRQAYRGINFILLLNRFEQPYYLTFKQVKALGGRICKGEKCTPVVFWKPLDAKKTDDKEHSETEKKFILRYYKVFNITQTTGIDYTAVKWKESAEDLQFDKIQKAESILTGYKDSPKVVFNSSEAFYVPSLDKVYVPKPEYFKAPEFFYSTLFHELSHSSGHKSRLNRRGIAEFNGSSHQYSYEELIAEFSASYLNGHSGIYQTTIEENAAYLQIWLRKLKDNTRWLVNAASAGQRAAEYILGVS